MAGGGQGNDQVTAGDAAKLARGAEGVARIAAGDIDPSSIADAAQAIEPAKKVVKKGIQIQLGCCAGLIFLFIFTGLFIIGLFNPSSGADLASADTVSNWTGSSDTVATLGSAKMPATSGKIGHEQHASKQECFKAGNTHYTGPNSYLSAGSVTNCMAFGKPRTTDQERWYFNMRWDTSSGYPNNVMHKKVIITNPANGKRIVASIEEYGPAAFLWTRDGINAGASPEVYNYLGLAGPYTKDPNDKKGYAEFGFAKDQNIPLGPLK